MSPTDVVKQLITAIEAKDIDAAVTLASPDISYENMPISPVVGREALAATLRAFLGAATEVDWRIVAQWEVGRTVINERLDRFKLGAGWLELPIAGVFEVDDRGLITLWRDYFDMSTYTRQLTALTALTA